MKETFFAACDRFWMQNPSLLYAIALADGIVAGLSKIFLLPLFVAFLLFLPLFSARRHLQHRILLALLVGVSGFVYAFVAYEFPVIEEEGVTGRADFVPETIALSTHQFGKTWVYTGKILTFVSDEDKKMIARSIPASISYKENKGVPRPTADNAYRIQGTLKKSLAGNYFLVPPRYGPRWVPLKTSYSSWCEWRLVAKKSISDLIKKRIVNKQNATFLAGMATGSFDDREMFSAFGRFGLQHIMAISGFHFAIIAAIIGGALKVCVPQRFSIPLLIFVMSGYFLFLGPGPSVVRAWLTVVISLFAYVINKSSTGLNTLGVALLLVLVYDPLMVRRVGFQFSALMTLAILLFYPLFNVWMGVFLPQKSVGMVTRMAFYDQWGYLGIAFFRNSCALMLAVNLFAIPLTLYYFHQFPLMGLLYNLFFPFLVSFSLLLLLLGLGAGLLSSFVGSLFHDLNNLYTYFMLNLVYQMPKGVDIIMRIEEIPVEAVVGVLSILILTGILLRYRLENQEISLREWKYI